MVLTKFRPITVKPLTVKVLQKKISHLWTSYLKHNTYRSETSPKRLTMVTPPLILPRYYFSPIIFAMPVNMGNYHIICKYLKCSLKAFSTWVYFTTVLNPSLTTLPMSLFLYILVASMTKLSSPLFITSVVDPLFSDICKLMYLTMYTPAGINLSPISCNYLNPSWNISSKSWILILSPSSLLKNSTLQPCILFYQHLWPYPHHFHHLYPLLCGIF